MLLIISEPLTVLSEIRLVVNRMSKVSPYQCENFTQILCMKKLTCLTVLCIYKSAFLSMQHQIVIVDFSQSSLVTVNSRIKLSS